MSRGFRGPRDDFFCWKFRVWYNLGDCVFRHHFQTNRHCAECEQGASNLEMLGTQPKKPRWSEILNDDWDVKKTGESG